MRLPGRDRCRRTAGLVDLALAEAELTADERAHVADCPCCARALAETRAFGRELARIGDAVAPEPLPLAPTLVAALDLETPEELSMRRPSLVSIIALAAAALAVASVFVLQPPSPPDAGSSPVAAVTASAAPSSTATRAPIVPVIDPALAAQLLGVSTDEVIAVSGGAIATRLSDGRSEVLGVTPDRTVVPLGVTRSLPAAGVGNEADVIGIVCTAGQFAGQAIVFGAIGDQSGSTSLPTTAGTLAVGSPAVIGSPRSVTYALDAATQRRTWLLLIEGTAGGGHGYGGGFETMPCDGSDPAPLLAQRDAERARDRAEAVAAADQARPLVPGGAALIGVEDCDGNVLARFWSDAGTTAGITVRGSTLRIVPGPDAPEVALARAAAGDTCRALPNPRTQADYDALPSVDHAQEQIVNDFGVRQLGYSPPSVAYLGPDELVIEEHDQGGLGPRPASGDPREYVGVVRRAATGWELRSLQSADLLDGIAGIGLIRLGAADSATDNYAAVYGAPRTPDVVAVDLTVAGSTYRYTTPEAGSFLAVVPAAAGDGVRYRYLDAAGGVVEQGDVPEG